MAPFTAVIDPSSRVDFYAGTTRAFQELGPIYLMLDEKKRGAFYVSQYVHRVPEIPTQVVYRSMMGYNPLVVASYKDLNDIFYIGEDRPFIVYEGAKSADPKGLLNVVALFICSNKAVYEFRKTINKEAVYCPTVYDIAQALTKFVEGTEAQVIEEIDGHSVGMIYVAFGERAAKGIQKSRASLRRLGYVYPTLVVGDTPVEGCLFQEWDKESPYDMTQRQGFRFRAGRVKPFLHTFSKWDYNLYLDADTQFIQPITDGFVALKDFDLVVTEEILSLRQLYNKMRAGWEINLIERDVTVQELGGNDTQKFINSGVFFFKKNRKTAHLFKDWYTQWMRYQQWDEQLSFMRAMAKNPEVKVARFSVDWNSPVYSKKVFIFHNYGKGLVRSDV